MCNSSTSIDRYWCAILVYQANPLGIELYFYANTFFCFIEPIWPLVAFVTTIYCSVYNTIHAHRNRRCIANCTAKHCIEVQSKNSFPPRSAGWDRGHTYRSSTVTRSLFILVFKPCLHTSLAFTQVCGLSDTKK